jgi:hypothetical protein
MNVCRLNFGRWGLVACVLAMGTLWIAREAAADKIPAPRRVEPAKSVIPVEIRHADLAGEGDGVKAKIVLPARLRITDGRKVGAMESISPRNRSIVAAVAMTLAAVSMVFVLRGKHLSNTTKGIILGLGILVGAGGIAFANAPPLRFESTPKSPPASEKSVIVIEFSGDAEHAVLTIAK